MPSIYTAALRGNLEEVKRLIQQDPELVHGDDNMDNFVPLHWASMKGHVEVTAYLLHHGARINEAMMEGDTALHLACEKGRLPVVELLLEKGADPTLPTFQRVIPLMEASRKGHVAVVRCLLHHPQALSTLNCRGVEGVTPLHWACTEKDHGGVVRELLEAGADPTMATERGETAMDVARRNSHDVCVELLEEWERHYLLTKARHLRDASHDHDVSQALADHPPSSSSSSSITTAKRARLNAAPTYLMGRVEKGEPLPTVEVTAVADGGGAEGDRSVREVEESLLVKVIMQHVVCGGLSGALFVELMEVMGRTGYRKDRAKKEGEGAKAEAAAAQEEEEGGVSSDDNDEDDDEEEEEADWEEGEWVEEDFSDYSESEDDEEE